ncbi:MAG: hypothetical protein ABS36_04100 [Acidobacteria bacterium SCN 69-37]|nr:MAG: hypothetical protein ABS36_04100 [Acidobacteria bacterium SCN 69-37]
MTAPRTRRTAAKKAIPAVDVLAAAGSELISIEAVRVRAYEIYLRRDGQGDELSDWLQAEQELLVQAG